MLGENEVRLTKLYTVHPSAKTTEHNPSPNWNYGAAPPDPSFEVVLEAEAGEDIGGDATKGYNIVLYCVDLTASPVAPVPALTPIIGAQVYGPLPLGSGWSLNIHTGEWSRQWILPVIYAPGDKGKLIQYYAVMRDAAGGTVSTCIASEPLVIF